MKSFSFILSEKYKKKKKKYKGIISIIEYLSMIFLVSH